MSASCCGLSLLLAECCLLYPGVFCAQPWHTQFGAQSVHGQMDQASVTYTWDLFLVLPPPSGMEELNWELEGPDWVSPVPISWPLARAASWGVSFHVAESENWPNRKAGDSPRCSRISEEWPPCFLLIHVHHTASGL